MTEYWFSRYARIPRGERRRIAEELQPGALAPLFDSLIVPERAFGIQVVTAVVHGTYIGVATAHLTLIAEADGTPFPAWEYRVFVAPPFRGAGVASELVSNLPQHSHRTVGFPLDEAGEGLCKKAGVLAITPSMLNDGEYYELTPLKAEL